MHSRSPRWWLHQIASLAVVTAWAVSMITLADRFQGVAP